MSDFLKVMKRQVLTRVNDIRIDVENLTDPTDFCAIFNNHSSPTIIAEIKLASPSRGQIYKGSLNPVQIGKEYMAQGASALSILTEPHFFKGNIQTIRDVRAELPTCPILLKDFVLDPIQIKQAQVFGANAILLIVGFLEFPQLCDLFGYAASLGLTALIEVHTEDELEKALRLNPSIIGINNRNLNTLTIDLKTSRALIPSIPNDVFSVCESGISKRAHLNEMSALGFDGFLIGSHMMQFDHPGEALNQLLRERTHAS